MALSVTYPWHQNMVFEPLDCDKNKIRTFLRLKHGLEINVLALFAGSCCTLLVGTVTLICNKCDKIRPCCFDVILIISGYLWRKCPPSPTCCILLFVAILWTSRPKVACSALVCIADYIIYPSLDNYYATISFNRVSSQRISHNFISFREEW